MDLKLSYQNTSNAQEAYDKVKKSITPQTLASYKVKADLLYNDGEKKIEATGKGFDLNMNFKPSEVEVELSVAFLIKPLKPKILSTLKKQLTEVL